MTDLPILPLDSPLLIKTVGLHLRLVPNAPDQILLTWAGSTPSLNGGYTFHYLVIGPSGLMTELDSDPAFTDLFPLEHF